MSGELNLESAVDVLVVDDTPDTLTAIAEVIGDEGYSVCTCSGPRAALAALQHGLRPKLILLDLNMPGMSGWAFCNELVGNASLESIPIAIITALPEYRGTPHRQSDAGIFRKPIDFEVLMAEVRRRCAA